MRKIPYLGYVLKKYAPIEVVCLNTNILPYRFESITKNKTRKTKYAPPSVY